jgi:hypothetical protein
MSEPTNDLTPCFRVYKYILNATGRTVLNLPIGAKVLDVAFQKGSDGWADDGALCLWALVDDNPNVERINRPFLSVVTGADIPGYAHFEYIGTARMTTGDPVLPEFVVHVFEVYDQQWAN